MMDVCSDPQIETVVFMTSSQIGKTEILLNIAGYFIDFDPSAILCLQPTQNPMAEDFSKDRLAPMIRDTPSLRSKIADPRSRDSGNTTLHKVFPGGHLTIAGANSPSNLASRPIRVLLCDEVDRYPKSAGTEGDPIDLATRRTANFWNRTKIYVSTPVIKGLSRIEMLYESGDKRKFHVPCPHCELEQTLEWENVYYPDDQPEEAILKCPHCEGEIDDVQRNAAVRKGSWIATGSFNGIASFHISALYSPWTPIAEVAYEYEARKNDLERLKTWFNTYLGLPFEDDGLAVDEHTLAMRAEDYGAEVPDEVLILTAGVDVHPDRLEMEVVGWADGDESWSIDYCVFYGDPEIPEGHEKSPWTALMDRLSEPYKRGDGSEIKVHTTGIDSGGLNTQAVYHFCKRKRIRNIFAFRGKGGEGQPIVFSPRKTKTGASRVSVNLYLIGVDQAKATIYRRFRKSEPGPGYAHFPEGRDPEYYEQLTSEKAVLKTVNGFSKRVWLKKKDRNEALDCRVYAYAALVLAAPRWDIIRKRREKAREEKKEFSESAIDSLENLSEKSDNAMSNRRKKPNRRKAGYVNSWKL